MQSTMMRSITPSLFRETQSIQVITKTILVVQLSVLAWATQVMPRDSSGAARGWQSLPRPCLDTALPGPSHLLLWGKSERHRRNIVKPKQFQKLETVEKGWCRRSNTNMERWWNEVQKLLWERFQRRNIGKWRKTAEGFGGLKWYISVSLVSLWYSIANTIYKVELYDSKDLCCTVYCFQWVLLC